MDRARRSLIHSVHDSVFVSVYDADGPCARADDWCGLRDGEHLWDRFGNSDGDFLCIRGSDIGERQCNADREALSEELDKEESVKESEVIDN